MIVNHLSVKNWRNFQRVDAGALQISNASGTPVGRSSIGPIKKIKTALRKPSLNKSTQTRIFETWFVSFRRSHTFIWSPNCSDLLILYKAGWPPSHPLAPENWFTISAECVLQSGILRGILMPTKGKDPWGPKSNRS